MSDRVNFPATLSEWIHYAAKQIQQSEANLESGMQEPYLESEYLACHALSLDFEGLENILDQPPPPHFSSLFADLLAQRIQKRLPAAYISNEAYFAGHRFFVDSRVLIPRSRIENILDDPEELKALIDSTPIQHILDLGTGSGCLAITLALAFPQAQVDASDISTEALKVADKNRKKFQLEERLHLIHSNLFGNLTGKRYDLIVSNPPYVPQDTLDSLPLEYKHEPMLALDGGIDGLRLVEPILHQAAQFLNKNGLLICEVGDETEEILMAKWPNLPVEWIHFHFGASGVFAARQEDLESWSQGEIE